MRRMFIVHLGVLLLSTVLAAASAMEGLPEASETNRSQAIRSSEEGMSITTAEGIVLEGLIAQPALDGPQGADTTHPIVILVHEFGRDRDSLRKLTDAFLRAGVAVALFDQRGHGASRIRKVDRREYIYTFPVIPSEEFKLAVEDMRLLLDSLDTVSGIDAERTAIVGVREGALVAAQAAGRFPEIDALVLIDTVVSTKGLDAARGLSRYGGRPALLVHSAFPSSIEISRALADYGTGERTLRRIDKYESGHLLFADDAESLAWITAWVGDKLEMKTKKASRR